MKQEITFYIARHGKTILNTLERVQGWCDSPLTKEGIDVARYLALGLHAIEFDGAYCSDLRRTKQTIEIILNTKGQKNLHIEEVTGLREACFGCFEANFNAVMWASAATHLGYTTPTKMTEAIIEKQITYIEVLRAIKELDTMDMAESLEEVEIRTQESLRMIAEKERILGHRTILIVSHGLSIVSMLGSLGGNKFINGQLENASVCKVTYLDGQFTVHSMGDMSYVEAGKAYIPKQ